MYIYKCSVYLSIVLTLWNNLSWSLFACFCIFFRELNFKEIEAYNRLQNVDCVSLPNLKDQVSGGSIDCVSLPNLKDQVSGGSIDCVTLPNLKDQVSGGSIDCVTLPNLKDQVSGGSIDCVSLPNLKDR